MFTHTNRIGLIVLIFTIDIWVKYFMENKPWYVTAVLAVCYLVGYMMFVWGSHDEKK